MEKAIQSKMQILYIMKINKLKYSNIILFFNINIWNLYFIGNMEFII